MNVKRIYNISFIGILSHLCYIETFLLLSLLMYFTFNLGWTNGETHIHKKLERSKSSPIRKRLENTRVVLLRLCHSLTFDIDALD